MFHNARSFLFININIVLEQQTDMEQCFIETLLFCQKYLENLIFMTILTRMIVNMLVMTILTHMIVNMLVNFNALKSLTNVPHKCQNVHIVKIVQKFWQMYRKNSCKVSHSNHQSVILNFLLAV